MAGGVASEPKLVQSSYQNEFVVCAPPVVWVVLFQTTAPVSALQAHRVLESVPTGGMFLAG